MKVYRIYITSWTASFRYPNIISGFQPTLPVPPLSTIMGLISAAKGSYYFHCKDKIGYVFRYKSKNVDLETVYQIKSLTEIKSNVIKREFLVDVELFLYTDSAEIKNYFFNPKYQLLLGRSSDLAQVVRIDEIEVEEKSSLSKIRGTILPFKKYGLLPGLIHALPKCFSSSIPRRNLETQPYCILDYNSCVLEDISISAKGFEDYDEKLQIDWDVYWQE